MMKIVRCECELQVASVLIQASDSYFHAIYYLVDCAHIFSLNHTQLMVVYLK